MRKVDLGTKALELRESLKFRAVVSSHCFKDLAEVLRSILLLKFGHRGFDTSTIASGDTDGNIVACHLFDCGKSDGLTAFTLANNGIDFPVPNLTALVDNSRPFFNASSLHALVFAHPLATPLASQDTRDIE